MHRFFGSLWVCIFCEMRRERRVTIGSQELLTQMMNAITDDDSNGDNEDGVDNDGFEDSLFYSEEVEEESGDDVDNSEDEDNGD